MLGRHMPFRSCLRQLKLALHYHLSRSHVPIYFKLVMGKNGSANEKAYAMHRPLSPKPAPQIMKHVHFQPIGISQMAKDT